MPKSRIHTLRTLDGYRCTAVLYFRGVGVRRPKVPTAEIDGSAVEAGADQRAVHMIPFWTLVIESWSRSQSRASTAMIVNDIDTPDLGVIQETVSPFIGLTRALIIAQNLSGQSDKTILMVDGIINDIGARRGARAQSTLNGDGRFAVTSARSDPPRLLRQHDQRCQVQGCDDSQRE